MKRLPTPRRLGGALIVLVLGLLGTLPLFAGPGYEMALAAGLLCPSVAAVVTALELSRRPRQPLDMLAYGFDTGTRLVLLAFGVAFLHGARSGFCDLAGGTALFALGPGVGTLLGGTWGALAGELARPRTRRRLVAVGAALLGPLGSAGVQLGIFYATPMVFAFDPFAGYFSGALYDTVLASEQLVSYRAASIATLFAVYVATLHLVRRPPRADEATGRLAYRSVGRPGLLLLGALAALGSLTSVAYGPTLGHWQTRASIALELGGRVEHGRCVLVHDARMPGPDVELMARECEAHVASIGAWLGLEITEPVTAFVFHSRGQKRALMGAGRVSVAKPWRREIYLHELEFPHRVMRHELVHALAADIGTGPFAVAGGLVPNPGLVEGIAEAAAPRDDNLSGHEWSAAMRAIKVLPRARHMFGLAFFTRASSTAYTAAGSFVAHVRELHGPDVIRRWYGGEDLPALTGSSWNALETSWWQRLDAIPLDDAARLTAELYFDRPSVLDRRCPHEVDELLDEATARVGGDNEGALRRLERVLTLDPGNVQALMGVAACHDARGDAVAAHAAYDVVATHAAAKRVEQLTALERRGDLALRSGDVDGARALYRDVGAGLTDEGRLRTLELKAHYAADPLGRRTLVALLVGSDERGPDTTEALDALGLWRAAAPHDGTPLYLLGRQHFNNRRWALALERLEQAVEAELPVERVRSESLRLALVAACALGRLDAARAANARYQAHPLVPAARRTLAAALLARCTDSWADATP